jgi:pimeloyl-ACP methyl ester carboxylesterase
MEFIVEKSAKKQPNGTKNIIFLHGWGADHNSFLWLKGMLKDNLYFADLDGFGGTCPPQDVTISGYAKRLENYIAKNNLSDVILVGHSFGGRVAIEYAASHNLAGLVLVDSAGLKPRFNLKRSYKIAKYKLAKTLVKLKILPQNRLKKYGSQDYQNASPQMKKVMLQAVNHDQTKLLSQISCPTLIVWGSGDDQTPPYMAKILHKKIAGSGLVMLSGGHFCFLENQIQFAKIIDYFAKNV